MARKTKSSKANKQLQNIPIWLLEFVCEVPTPEADPLRTWLLFLLIEQFRENKRTVHDLFGELEEHLEERWCDGITNEYWELNDAHLHINRWCGSMRRVLDTGQEQTAVAGLSCPSVTSGEFDDILDLLDDMRESLCRAVQLAATELYLDKQKRVEQPAANQSPLSQAEIHEAAEWAGREVAKLGPKGKEKLLAGALALIALGDKAEPKTPEEKLFESAGFTSGPSRAVQQQLARQVVARTNLKKKLDRKPARNPDEQR